MSATLPETISLQDFAARPAMHLRRLRAHGGPEVIAVEGDLGEGEVVVQNAAAYREMVEALRHRDSVERVRRGLEEIDAGRCRPMREFLEELGSEHGIQLRR